MTNSKKRRLAKVQVGGNVGAPSPLGNRAARRHGEVARPEALVPEAAVDSVAAVDA